ncbi:P-loop ATPase [Vibrio ishigakensis]|uniref:tRNA(Met) cytidine acetyltransferase TmcA n=1 Tax=Vibrio ishigakensis TaxID=1481914 RepID=A0A0B8Q4G8_9VIBR|nr:P-loop ATPase [Vibrio ishigakensis]
MSYLDSAQQLLSLIETAKQRFHRFGVVLRGSDEWQQATLEQLGSLTGFERVIELGSKTVSFAESLSFKQARTVLGQESDLIVADLNAEFDADGLTAACGTLKGGGLLLLKPKLSLDTPFDNWLSNAMESLVELSEAGITNPTPYRCLDKVDPYAEQKEAIQAVHKVLNGHRKRPLVITADRGRGKSSALGIASAEIIRDNDKRILVTAPNKSAVATLFERAGVELDKPVSGSKLESASGGSIEYIAPDELLRSLPNCDLLLVDEASAIPLPLLKQIVTNYHRVCFSTTVHGYEGCGRGFSLKFEPWLESNRPGWKAIRLSQPIRWNPEDSLEAWLFDAFLLDAEVGSAPIKSQSSLEFSKLMTEGFLNSRALLSDCFGLLVNAHYQTAPNDLVQLLNDSKVSVYQATQDSVCVGVVLAVEEGGLDSDTIRNVQLGKRRPVGHLVPVSLANHLATAEPATQKSLRVMRIAVHPELQGKGVGSALLEYLSSQAHNFSYLSTSFGATAELFDFWNQNKFVCVRLGVKQDQASGCFSTILVKPLLSHLDWLAEAKEFVTQSLLDTAPDYHLRLQNDLLFRLLQQQGHTTSTRDRNLISNYANGGNSFETCRSAIASALVNLLSSGNEFSFDMNWGLLISAGIKKMSWGELAKEFGFTGKKQVEQALRVAVSDRIIRNLQCK